MFKYFLYILLLLLLCGGRLAFKILHAPRMRVDITPADKGLVSEDIIIESADGLKLAAWLIRKEGASATILLCHGRGTSKADLLDIAEFLAKDNYNLLLFDFRAHGDSQGKWLYYGGKERLDIRAAVEYIKKDGQLKELPIGIFAVSYGAAAVYQTLSSAPEISAFVSDSAYASLRKIIKDQQKAEYPYLPEWLPAAEAGIILSEIFVWRTSVRKLNPINYISQIKTPLFIIHGEKDVMVPVSEAKELFERANQPKEIWLAPNAEHFGAFAVYSDEYKLKVRGFFEKHLK